MAEASARLVYQPLSQEHEKLLWPVLTDPSVNAFFEEWPRTEADIRDEFERMIAGPGVRSLPEKWLNFAVLRAADGVALGRVQATIQTGFAETAFVFGRDHWGMGYATEAGHWLHAHLATHYSVSEFWFVVRPDNVRSRRLAARLGYVPVEDAADWPSLRSYDPCDLVLSRLAIRSVTV